MSRLTPSVFAALLLSALSAHAQDVAPKAAPPPAPPIGSMSALAFAPDGTLFVGDAKNAAVFAIDLGARPARTEASAVAINDVETKLAALLGARPEDIVVHDLASDPRTLDVYVAVSRNRGKWDSPFSLPNDTGDATELVRIAGDGTLHGVDLAGAKFTRADLPRPIAPGTSYEWKPGVDKRTEAITDIAWDDGQLWVAGLSNEEFASALWRLPYPFTGKRADVVTLENYHVAHGKWETEAPVRALLPYVIDGKRHLVAAYLCTPLVLFETDALVDGAHVKGRTIAEFGAGNYPLDLVLTRNSKGDRFFLANSNLPLMIIDAKQVAEFEGALTEPVAAYTAGVPVQYRSGAGIQQLDLRGPGQIVLLRRHNSGALGLETWALAK